MQSRRKIALVAVVVLVASVGYVTARSRRDFVDFEVFRTAGIRALAGEPLYRAEDGHYQFKYWPAFAFAVMPFAGVGPETGKVIWYALSVGVIAFFLRQSIRILPDRRSTARALTWWTVLLTGKFLVIELVNGQTNALLGALIVLALTAVQAGRPAAAGALVALAAFVKPYALLLLPWLVVTQGVRASASALAVLVAGWMLPAVWYGWQGNLNLLAGWYSTVTATTSENLMVRENISFATMWAKWIGGGPAASGLAVLSVAGVLAVPVAMWGMRKRVEQPAYLEVSALLLLMPLISPQGWDYVLLAAVPAFVCLVDWFRASPAWSRVVIAAGFAMTSLAIYDLLGRPLYFAFTAASGVTIGVLLLVASLAGLRWRAAA